MTDFSRFDQKLEFILRTAARIFAEKGYHSTSMRDISRATGVSLAGLYHYCRSKEELLFLIQDHCFGRVLERLEERLSETDDAIQRLRVLIENHLSFFAANVAEMKVLSHEADSLDGDFYEQVANKKRHYTRLARRILSDVRQSAERTGTSPAPTTKGTEFRVPKDGKRQQSSNGNQNDLVVATYALFGMMNWIYNWYDPRGKLSVSDLAATITRLFLTGFLAKSNAADLRLVSALPAESVSVWHEPHKIA